jgi:hypothetical protein
VKETLDQNGAVPMRMTSAEFGKFMEQDIQVGEVMYGTEVD